MHHFYYLLSGLMWVPYRNCCYYYEWVLRFNDRIPATEQCRFWVFTAHNEFRHIMVKNLYPFKGFSWFPSLFIFQTETSNLCFYWDTYTCLGKQTDSVLTDISECFMAIDNFGIVIYESFHHISVESILMHEIKGF